MLVRKCKCGDTGIRLILRQRIDDLSDFWSTLPGRVWAKKMKPGEPGVLLSHHCSVTLIVTVKLLRPNTFVGPLTQADILSSQR